MRPRPFFGVPLILLALIWAGLALTGDMNVPVGPGHLFAFALIAFYAGVGIFLCFSGSQLARRLGMVAWMLIAVALLVASGGNLLTRMVVFCAITILVLRLRVVPTNPETMQIPLEACTPEGRAAFLARRLRAEFGIPSDSALAADSFRDVHAIPPGRLATFLDNLHCDSGFRISGDDADGVDSGTELLSLIDRRHPYATSNSEETATT